LKILERDFQRVFGRQQGPERADQRLQRDGLIFSHYNSSEAGEWSGERSPALRFNGMERGRTPNWAALGILDTIGGLGQGLSEWKRGMGSIANVSGELWGFAFFTRLPA
jgi:hypothetical protein